MLIREFLANNENLSTCVKVFIIKLKFSLLDPLIQFAGRSFQKTLSRFPENFSTFQLDSTFIKIISIHTVK